MSVSEIAVVFQVGLTSVRRYMSRAAAGLSVHPRLPPGATPKLTDEDLAWLKTQVETNPYIIELKAVEQLQPIHTAQVLTYLKLTGLDTGLLVNFNVPVLMHGLRRLTRKRTLPVLPSSCESTPADQLHRSGV